MSEVVKDEFHEPVMIREVLENLGLVKAHLKNQAQEKKKTQNNRQKFIDATLGTGGHCLEIIKAGGDILGIDVDCELLEIARKRLNLACPTTFGLHERGSFKLVCGNFRFIDEIARENGFPKVRGILFDLGVTNLHLTSPKKGFSFTYPETALDMRLNSNTQEVTGADLLNGLRQDQLEDLFGRVLNYSASILLARKVVEKRQEKKISTVGDFLNICQVIKGKPGLHPATLPFLALRLAVNSELENLEEALPKAFTLLDAGGRLLIITFHSSEDRIAKKYFKEISEKGLGKIKDEPIFPSEEEIHINPRARSAKLRVLIKS